MGYVVAYVSIAPTYFWLDMALRLGMVPLLLTSAVAMVVRRRSGPPRFDVREGVGFAVPASRSFDYFVVFEVVLCGLLAGEAIRKWSTRPGLGGAFVVIHYTLASLMSVVTVPLVGLVISVVVVALRARPRVELTPQAVRVREALGSRTVPWEALRPGLPVPGGWLSVTLTVDRRDLVVRRGLVWGRPRIEVAFVRVHPWVLADAIRYYVDHPDRRAAIGTHAEHDRLLADLAQAAVV
jgi:hypothetical protein